MYTISSYLSLDRVTIYTNDGGSLDVPKFMLCNQSPVIQSLFAENPEVRERNTVEIKQFDPDVVRNFVHYIKYGRIPQLDLYAVKLYEIAQFYEVKDLGAICYVNIISNVNSHNALDIFLFACKFEFEMLKKHALNVIKRYLSTSNFYYYYQQATEHDSFDLMNIVFQFMIENFWQVFKTEEWTKLPVKLQIDFLKFYKNLELPEPVQNVNDTKFPLKVQRGSLLQQNSSIGTIKTQEYMLENITNTPLACVIYALSVPSREVMYKVSSSKGFILPKSQTFITITQRNYVGKFYVMFKLAHKLGNFDECFNEKSTPSFRILLDEFV